MIQVVTPCPNETARHKDRLHLLYLDGIRGLSALYVVFHHSVLYNLWGQDSRALPLWLKLLWKVFSLGHVSVVVFIVLSGYCLAMPPAMSPTGWFPGGALRYFKRRAFRILPPYYAALLLSLLLIALLPARWFDSAHVHWKDWLPAFTPGAILSHLFLIQNLHPHWWAKIDGPTWTVATEWQLYFLLPLLISICRRWGLFAMVMAGFALGVGIHIALPCLDDACLWFSGCFAFGAAAAMLNFSKPASIPRLSLKVYRSTALALSALSGLALTTGLPFISSHPVLLDSLIGLTAAAILVLLTHLNQMRSLKFLTSRSTVVPGKPLLTLLFESRVSTGLGTISFSLYLVHGPILNTLQMLARTQNLGLLQSQLLLIGLGIPLAWIAASLLYRFVEKPSMQFRG